MQLLVKSKMQKNTKNSLKKEKKTSKLKLFGEKCVSLHLDQKLQR